MYTSRQVVRVAATGIGLVGGALLFPLIVMAYFVMTNEEIPEGYIALLTPLLLVPLVVLAAVWPRMGGRLIVFASLLSAGAFLWSLVDGPQGSMGQVAGMLGLYGAIGVLGAAFWWVERKSAERAGETRAEGPGL